MFPTFESIVPDNNVQILLSMAVAAFINWRSIPMIVKICSLRGLLENPVKRSSHSVPTPTFGGIAIFAGTIIGYMLWNFGDEGNLLHRVFAGLIMLFFLGLKDDLFALAPTKKVVSQVIASLVVVVGSDLRIDNFFGIFGVNSIPYLISIAVTIIVFIAIINAFNLIDGIDGLAGSIGMISSGGFGLWFFLNSHYSLACLSLTLSASLAGFLYHNFSTKSKIFMGDTGSLIVGYLNAIFAIKFIYYNVSHSFDPNYSFVSAPIIAIVMLIVPIFDTLRVFSIRILRKKSPFKADRLHMHHLIVDNGFTHFQTTLMLSLATIALTILTYYSRKYFSNTQLCSFIIFLFVIYIFIGNWLETRRVKVKKESLNGKFSQLDTATATMRFKEPVGVN